MSDERLERNVIIARSGVYQYTLDELSRMEGIDVSAIPDEYKDQRWFGVYTPTEVILEASPLFTKLPITREHPSTPVNPDNFKELAIGWSGDSTSIVPVIDSKEIGIQSTCVLADRDGLDYYDKNVRDVSPGYYARYKWEPGKTADGEEYQIVKHAIDKVNHLAFTQMGRGGPEISMDSVTNFASLIYFNNRMTTDSAPTFNEMVDDIVTNRNEYDEEEIKTGVDTILAIVETMPDCKEKSILTRIIKEFYRVKDFTGDSSAINSANFVKETFKILDSKIMEDSMGLFGKKPTTDAAPEPEEKEPVPAAPETPSADAPPAEEGGSATPDPAPAGEAPPAAGGEAPAAEVAPETVQQAAMSIGTLPDDPAAVMNLSQEQLAFLLSEVIKFLKTVAPGEAQEPEHQEPVGETVDGGLGSGPVDEVVSAAKKGFAEGKSAGEATEDSEEEKKEREATMDSIFGMPLGDSNRQTKSLDDLSVSLFGKKGAK